MDPLTLHLLRAQDGDPAAFELFVRHSRRDLLRYCTYLGDADTAEDLVQDTYLRALRSLHTYRAEAPALPWLLTIARRACADTAKRRQRHREITPHPTPQGYDPTAHHDLVGLLDRLDSDQRHAFVLTQILGYSYADAAALAHCPIGTIRSRVARARAELAEAARLAATA